MSAFLGVFLPLLLAYSTALLWCWDLWWADDSYFAHGPLVPIVIAAVVWSRRAEWRTRPAQPDPKGFLMLGPALVLHLVGAALTIDSLSAASLALAVPGAAWVALGRERLRGLWPALWLTAFAIPLSIYVTGRLAFELKEVAVRGGVWLTQFSGLDVVREGAELYVPAHPAAALFVADACSGLRSLLAMITVAYCIAFLMGPPAFWRRTLLLVAAAPVAVLVNLLRIFAICWVAQWYDVPFASGTGHDLLNGLAWVVDFAVLLGFDALLSRRGTPPAPRPETTLVPQAAPAGRWPRVLLWALCGPLMFLSLYRPGGESSGRAEALPTVAGPFVLDTRHEMTARFFSLLGTDDAIWRTYRDTDDSRLFVVGVFHGSNWKSVHPPRVCLEGSNMDVVEDGTTRLGPGSDARVGRIVLRSRGDGRMYVSLYAYGARGMVTGDYFEFFLHHAPRALFRASNDGFLLRVESYADDEDGVLAAEQRCRELLIALLHEAEGLLP
ncbi:MAG: exosortase/archaeosortase family protein [Planctomycetota bacterium]